jgi:hypothetical protein
MYTAGKVVRRFPAPILAFSAMFRGPEDALRTVRQATGGGRTPQPTALGEWVPSR